MVTPATNPPGQVAAVKTQPTQGPQAVAKPPAAPLTREQKLAALCRERFLKIRELDGAAFSHEGLCTKCGWHTMQHSAEAADTMTQQHVLTHWKDVASQI